MVNEGYCKLRKNRERKVQKTYKEQKKGRTEE